MKNLMLIVGLMGLINFDYLEATTVSSTSQAHSNDAFLAAVMANSGSTDQTVIREEVTRFCNEISNGLARFGRRFQSSCSNLQSLANDPELVRYLLFMAVTHQCPNIIMFLLSTGISVNTAINARGQTLLHRAVASGQDDLVCRLINAGASLDVKDRRGYAPLHFAVFMRNEAVVQALISRNADVNVKNSRGEAPLHFAACVGNSAVVQALISNNADVNIKDNRERTPLHFAGSSAMVQALAGGGANMDARNDRGNTPLHFAVCAGNDSVVQVLISNGADVNISNDLGKTPLDVAHQYCPSLVDFLVASGARSGGNLAANPVCPLI